MQMYRWTARLAADGKNIVVERQWQVHEDQVGDHNWKTVDRFNTPLLSKVPPSKKWLDPIPPAEGICRDEECREHNPQIHFMTDQRCINYGFDQKPIEPSSGCGFCDINDPLEVRYGRRQHYLIGDEPQWVDCKNQQNLLPPPTEPSNLPLNVVSFIATKLRQDEFVAELIVKASSSDNACVCEVYSCVKRAIDSGIMAPEVSTIWK